MNKICLPYLEAWFDTTIYRYQVFQITPIVIKGYLSAATETQDPIFNILENGSNQLSIMEIMYATFYPTELDAKKKQALDLHRMLNNSYKGHTQKEKDVSDYFRRFIDEHDLDFFISSVTNHQLYEEEYYKLLSLIAETHPEYII